MSARAAAAELLVEVLDRGAPLDEAFARTALYDRLDGRDRAFAAAIARATLRHLGRIDLILSRFLANPLPDTADRARAVLRSGAAQILFLRTPPHAAVSEAVDLANSAKDARGFAKLINAVLRKVASVDVSDLPDPAQNLPDWLRTRWTATYGAEAVAEIAAGLTQEPPLDLTVKADAEAWAETLNATLLPTGTLRLNTNDRSVADLPGYDDGAWWVQDAAAALPAQLLGDISGQRVLDLCAAPGGKTLQLAAAGAHVTALDISERRLDRLRRNLKRTKLSADIVVSDAQHWRPKQAFDAILLDAPCSSTGTLRRHPEASWLRKPTQILSFAQTQSAMLASAAEMIKPGGTLVYAVCSMEPEEGPGVIAGAIESGAWERAPVELAALPEVIDADGALRTLPRHLSAAGGMDGFYAARLTRR